MSGSKIEKKHAGGRPTILTPEIQQIIVEYVQAGSYIEAAAAAAGISKPTVYDWLKRGAKEPGTIFEEFSNAVKKGLAEGEMRLIALVSTAAQKHWVAAAWMLERKFNERWGRRERKDITMTGTIAHIPLTPEQEREYEKAVALFFGTGEEIASLESDDVLDIEGLD